MKKDALRKSPPCKSDQTFLIPLGIKLDELALLFMIFMNEIANIATFIAF